MNTLHKTKNILVASRPGVGKTHYCIEYYINKINSGYKGVFFSLEMSNSLLMDKIVSFKTDNPITKNSIQNICIAYEDSLDDIIGNLENADKNIDFIIIDYLQLLKIDRNYEQFFKYLKEKKISLLMTTQLSRGEKINKQNFTDLLLRVREQDILEYFNEARFLSEKKSVISIVLHEKIFNDT